jgi:ABC-type uncharacterized transport system auxiliary subunit
MKKAISIVIVLLAACSSKKTAKEVILPIKTMQQTVWQLMQVDEFLARQIQTDTTVQPSREKVQYYQRVFDLNKVDRVQFYATMAYLDKHPVELKELMDSVEALSKREKLDFIKH